MLFYLPSEIILKISSELSVIDIFEISRVSKRCYQVSQDDLLWKVLVKRDFGVKYRVEDTWKDEYLYLFRKDVNKWLVRAIEINDFNLVKYAIYRGANNYHEATETAASKGNCEMVAFLKEEMNYHCLPFDRYQVLDTAIRFGHQNLVKYLFNRYTHGDFLIDSFILTAAESGRIKMIYLLSEILGKETVTSHYNDILERAASKGHLKFIFEVLYRFRTRFESDDQNSSGYNMDFILLYPDFEKALKSAISGGHFEVSIFLLDKLSKLNIKPNYLNLIIRAVYGGSLELFSFILKRLEKDDLEPNYEELLLISCDMGNLQIFRLLSSKVNQEFLDDKRLTLLEKAIIGGHIELVKLFLDIHLSDESSSVLILEALKRGYLKIIGLILEYKEKFQITSHFNSFLLEKCIQFKNLRAFKLILSKTQELTPNNFRFLFEHAWQCSSSKIGSFLLNYFVEKEIPFEIGSMVWETAIKSGNIEVIHQVINENTNIEGILCIAIQERNLQVVEYILNRAKNLSREETFQNALSIAAKRGYKSILTRILEHLTEREIEPDYGPILMQAATAGEKEIFKDLLCRAYKDHHNYPSYLHCAVRGGNFKIVKMLIKVIGKFDYNNHLRSAISTCNCRMVKFILETLSKYQIEVDYKGARKTLNRTMKEDKEKNFARLKEILGVK